VYVFQGKNTNLTLTGHTQTINQIISLKNNNLIASCSNDATVIIWLLSNGTLLHTLKGHSGYVNQLISLQDGHLASGGQDTNIYVWDPVVGSRFKKLVGHSNVISSFVQLTNGYLVSGSYDSKIIIWNTSGGSIVNTLNGHTDNVNVLLLLSNGLLSSGSKDTTVKVWNPNNGSLLLNLNKHTGSVDYLVQLETGNLASSSSDSTIKYWDLSNGNMLVNISMDELKPTFPPRAYSGSVNIYFKSNLILLENGFLATTMCWRNNFATECNLNIFHPQSGYLIRSLQSWPVNIVVLKNNYLVTFDASNPGRPFSTVIFYDGFSLSSIQYIYFEYYVVMVSSLKNGYIALASHTYTINILY